MAEEIIEAKTKEYPVVVGVLKFFGWLVIIFGVIGFLLSIAEIHCLLYLLSGLAISTLFFAIARIIKVLVDIEENTRKK